MPKGDGTERKMCQFFSVMLRARRERFFNCFYRGGGDRGGRGDRGGDREY